MLIKFIYRETHKGINKGGNENANKSEYTTMPHNTKIKPQLSKKSTVTFLHSYNQVKIIIFIASFEY